MNYAALRLNADNSCTLLTLYENDCTPEERDFANGTDAGQWLDIYAPEAHTIPLKSLEGLARYRASLCEEEEERTPDRT